MNLAAILFFSLKHFPVQYKIVIRLATEQGLSPLDAIWLAAIAGQGLSPLAAIWLAAIAGQG